MVHPIALSEIVTVLPATRGFASGDKSVMVSAVMSVVGTVMVSVMMSAVVTCDVRVRVRG